MIKVGINGFGRVGRAVFRVNQSLRKPFPIAAVNDLDPDVRNHAYLVRYDSTYGRFPGKVAVTKGSSEVRVNGTRVKFHAQPDPARVPWRALGVDVLIDATGVHANVLAARKLVQDRAISKAIITHSPPNGVDHTIVFGVNESTYNPRTHHVLSASICDAIASAPVLSLLDRSHRIKAGYITTLHPWLSYQNVVDGTLRSVGSPSHFWTDYSLGRAGPGNLIPKDTTLIAALTPLLPSVSRHLEAMSFRIPTGIVAASTLTLQLGRPSTAAEINRRLKAEAARRPHVIAYQEDPCVSTDYLGITQSVAVEGRWTRDLGGGLIRLVLWYDNEWSYAHRVLDLVALLDRSNR